MYGINCSFFGQRALLSLFFFFVILEPRSAQAVLLDVPYYAQCDPAWDDDNLGTCSSTMCGYGCAVTSLAMVYEYYGGDMNPGELNVCLRNNGGFQEGCYLIWDNACKPSGTSFLGLSGDIDTELDAGYPVIVEVNTPTIYMHFVVAVGNEGGTYQINDPIDSQIKTFGEGGYNIVGIRKYHGTHVDPCECGSSDSEVEECDLCGTRERTCENGCDWGSWSSCHDQGVCPRSTNEPCGVCGERSCNESCQWDPCDDPCALQDGSVTADAASGDSASGSDAHQAEGPGNLTGGCRCSWGRSTDRSSPVLLALLALLVALVRRRKAHKTPMPPNDTSKASRPPGLR